MGAVCRNFLRIEHRDREMVSVFARWPSRRDDKVFDSAADVSVVVEGRVGLTLPAWRV